MRIRLQRFLAYVRPYRRLIFIASIAGIIRYVIPLFVPWGIKILIDDVLPNRTEPEAFWKLHWVILSLLAAYLIWFFVSVIRYYFAGQAGHKIIFDLRHQLFLHLQKMSLDYFSKRQIGSIVARMTDDIRKAQDVVGYGMIASLMDVTSIIVIVAILFWMHGKLALISLAVFPGYMAVSYFFMRKMYDSNRQIQESASQLSGHLHEKFAGVSLVQSFAREAHEEKIFLGRSQSHFDSVLRNVKLQAVGLSITGFLVAVTPLFVMWYGGWSVLNGSLTLGEFVAFYAYIGLLYAPVARLLDLSVVMSGALAAIDRIFEVLDCNSDVLEKANAVDVKRASGYIEFNEVSFAYGQNNKKVLDDVIFEIGSGEHVILTGSSGAGKSTILKLLLRFYDISGGSILIDGIDIRDMTLKSLREQIALVTQEPVLFSGTIFENILYGKLDATPQEVAIAAQAAYAHEFIVSLPEQYDTWVGERGVRLSVGEKQRIAIARAFLKDAPILLLDEPTSALDEGSAKIVRRSLQNLKYGRTVLEITHHIDNKENIDRIILLDHAKITDTLTITSCKISS